MRQSQGCTKNENNTRKDQYGRSMGAMPRIMVQQENKRQLDTIRVRAIERNIRRQGRKDSARNAVRRFRKCRNHRNGAERAKMCEVSGIALLRLGSNISALDYVSKNGVSVTERNNLLLYLSAVTLNHWAHLSRTIDYYHV